MNALLLLSSLLVLQAPQGAPNPGTPPTERASVDGKVSGVNASVFSALQAMKKRMPGGTFLEADARELAVAIQKDKTIDAAEKDLLLELTRASFSACTVTGAGGDAPLTFYTASGSARKVLLDLLYPLPDLETAWKSGADGYKQIVAYYLIHELNRDAVLTFIEKKFEASLGASNQANGYRPLQDELARVHAFTDPSGEPGWVGREMLYKAIQSLSKQSASPLPESVYSWVRGNALPFIASTVAGSVASIDGRVPGLNPTVYEALSLIRKRNPNTLTDANAQELKAAILKDSATDAVERDLLRELTQNQFRGITITPAEGTGKVQCYPTSGNAKKVLQETLNPLLNLEAAWDRGAAGFNEMIAAYKSSPLEETRVVNFVAQKMSKKWEESTLSNAYKPLRDQIAQLYGYSSAPGSDVHTGRTILHKAMKQADRDASDRIPDFLYSWVRPGG